MILKSGRAHFHTESGFVKYLFKIVSSSVLFLFSDRTENMTFDLSLNYQINFCSISLYCHVHANISDPQRKYCWIGSVLMKSYLCIFFPPINHLVAALKCTMR